MKFTLLTPADYREMPWANGRGKTVELLRREDASGALRVRLSIADVVEAGSFSALPGIDRVLTLIEGEGFDLDFGDAAPPAVALPFEPIGFSGDWPTTAQNLRGPSRDFNVMTATDCYDVSVSLLPEGPSPWPDEDDDEEADLPPTTGQNGTSCFYVVSGSAIIGALGLYLRARDLLIVETAEPIDVDAFGEVLAVRLTPLD